MSQPGLPFKIDLDGGRLVGLSVLMSALKEGVVLKTGNRRSGTGT